MIHCNRCGAKGASFIQSLSEAVCSECIDSELRNLNRQLQDVRRKNRRLKQEITNSEQQLQLF